MTKCALNEREKFQEVLRLCNNSTLQRKPTIDTQGRLVEVHQINGQKVTLYKRKDDEGIYGMEVHLPYTMSIQSSEGIVAIRSHRYNQQTHRELDDMMYAIDEEFVKYGNKEEIPSGNGSSPYRAYLRIIDSTEGVVSVAGENRIEPTLEETLEKASIPKSGSALSKDVYEARRKLNEKISKLWEGLTKGKDHTVDKDETDITR